MRRAISWKQAFWLTAGILPAILISMGPMAAIVGTPSIFVWTLSTLVGFVQIFLYAELAGIFPNKTGGASIYGAVAWLRYGKIFAPINVWSYWLAWSTALAVTAGIAGNYVISVFFVDTPLAKFSITLLDFSALLPGISFKLDGSILCAAGILLLAFYLQNKGIVLTAKIQFVLALVSVIPLLLLTVVPLVTGKVNPANFVPLIPQGTTSWFSGTAFTLMMGGMFIAGGVTYSAEIAACYVSEYEDPVKDGIRNLSLAGVV